jgi:hypothetical protein
MDSQKKDDAAYSFSTSVKEGIFEIIINGELTSDSIPLLMKELNDAVISSKAEKVLVDVRKVQSHFGYAETYLLAVKNPSCFDKIPTAIFHDPVDSRLGSFHEDLMIKNGLLLRWFTDIDMARNWLKKLKRKKPISQLH